MKNNLLYILIAVLLLIVFLMFLSFKPANVIVEYQEQFKLNEPLRGSLSITLESQDSIKKETPLLLSLSKGDKILEAKTLTLDEFIQLSNNPISPTKKDSGSYYETPGTYSVDLEKLIPYTFVERGEYELLFNIFKIDLTIRRKITVD